MGSAEKEREEERRLRKLAKKRVGFKIHLILYLAINAFLVTVNLITSPSFPWALFPLGGWGIGVLSHGLAVKKREAIEREIERLKQRGD